MPWLLAAPNAVPLAEKDDVKTEWLPLMNQEPPPPPPPLQPILVIM